MIWEQHSNSIMFHLKISIYRILILSVPFLREEVESD